MMLAIAVVLVAIVALFAGPLAIAAFVVGVVCYAGAKLIERRQAE